MHLHKAVVSLYRSLCEWQKAAHSRRPRSGRHARMNFNGQNSSWKVQPGHWLCGSASKVWDELQRPFIPLSSWGSFCSVQTAHPHLAVLGKPSGSGPLQGGMLYSWPNKLTPSLLAATSMNTRGQV